jgi:hypothetical protein
VTREILNPRTGQRIRFLMRTDELLRIETVNPPVVSRSRCMSTRVRRAALR